MPEFSLTVGGDPCKVTIAIGYSIVFKIYGYRIHAYKIKSQSLKTKGLLISNLPVICLDSYTAGLTGAVAME